MYPREKLNTNYDDEDDGTMPANVDDLAEAVVGHRIVSAGYEEVPHTWRRDAPVQVFVIQLDNGTRVQLGDTHDCCAYTELIGFLLHADKIDHIITGVGTTDGFNTWHIYADFGDVLELNVGWSCGNAFYYGYGFYITVEPLEFDGLS